MRTRLLLLLLVVAFVLASSGCTRGKRNTCSFFTKMLSEPTEMAEGLRKVGELGCTRAVPRLGELYEAGSFREDVTRATKFVINKARSNVERMRGEASAATEASVKEELTAAANEKAAELVGAEKEAHALILRALQVAETSVIAASIIEEWATTLKDFKMAGAEDTLVKVIRDDALIKSRTASIKALAAAQKDPKVHEDLFIWVLDQSPNAQGIDAFRVAVQQLGHLRSNKGLPQILRAMFIRNQKNEESYSMARWAAARVGKPAATAMVRLLEGEDAEFQTWAQQRGVPDWAWRYGPKLIQSLADIRQPDAAPAIMKNLSTPIRPLENVAPDTLKRWQMNQVNRIKMCMVALGAMRNDAIVDTAKQVILEPNNDISQRLDTASALAMMGTPAARSALFDVFKKSPKAQFRQPLVIPMVLGMHSENKKAFDRTVLRDKSELVSKRLEDPRVVAFLAVLEKCGDDGACYLGVLTDEKADRWARVKAALMLAHSEPDSEKLFQPMMDAFLKSKSVHTDLKRYLLMGIARNVKPDKKQAMADAHSSISGSRRLAYWAAELEMLLVWVSGQQG